MSDPSSTSLAAPPLSASESLLHPSAHPLRMNDQTPLLPSVVTEPLLETDSEEHDGRSVEERLRPTKRWVLAFPASLDAAFAPVDDALIAALQRPLNSALRLPYIGFALLLTVFTAIEFGLVLPFMLYLVGFDELGDLAVYLLLVLSVVSQVPKRFMWRPRPWMVKRALKVRKDKTSSFPSRAVTCAVVYGALLAAAIGPSPSIALLLLVCGVAALLASLARVIVGAHYPSDCLVGAAAGAAITAMGWGFAAAQTATCGACTTGTTGGCYDRTASALSLTHVAVNPLVPVLGLLLSSLLLFALSAPPLHFWTKCSYVLGVLTPCVLFRSSFLCPPLNSAALPEPPGHSGLAYGLALFLALVCTGCAKVMNGLRGVFSWLAFVAITALLYVVLAICRLNQV